MNLLKQDYQVLSREERRAFWSALFLTVGTLIVSINISPAWVSSALWAGYLVSAAVFLLCLGPAACGGFILKGHSAAGAFLFVLGLYSGMLAITVTLEGVGFLLAFLVFISSIYICGLLLSKRAFTWLPVASLFVCSAIVLIDMYAAWPRWQLSVGHRQMFSLVCGLIIAAYIFFMSRQFRHFGLGMKLVLIALGLTIVPIVVVGVISNQAAKQALEVSANQSLVDSASQVGARLDSFIDYNLDTVRTEAAMIDFVNYLLAPRDDRVGSVLEERVRRELEAFRQRDPDYIISYVLLDERGVVVVDTQGSEIGKDLSSWDYFQEPFLTRIPYVSPVRYSAEGSGPYLHFSALVQNEDGEALGVLRIRYHALVLQQMMSVQADLSGTQFYSILVDDNQMVLANSLDIGAIGKSILPVNENRLRYLRKEQIVPEDAGASDYAVELPALVSGLENIRQQPNFAGSFQTLQDVESDSEEPQEQAGAIKMSTQPWRVVVVESREILFEPAQRLVNVNLIVGVIAALFSTIFVVFMANYLADPIARLTEFARQFARGDLSVRASVTSEDEIGTLAGVFNQMAVQLSGLVGALEKRVEDRTRALAASAEISRRLSTVMDADQLVQMVVELLQESFQYYSVRIYLLDVENKNLVFAWGSGQPGRTRLTEGYSLPSGEGVWGRCIELAAPVLLGNVYQDNGWQPDLLLPKTHSALVAPMMIGETVLGILEIQHERENGLTETDAELLQSIASQVAVAYTNARSFSAAQRRADREALISTISQRVQHTNSVEDALRVTARELGRALGVETIVRLGARDKKRTG